MHRTSDEWKENVRNINETKPKQENCPTLKLARSLLKVVNYLGILLNKTQFAITTASF